MKSEAVISNRNKYKALVASISMPGLGQFYNGDLIKGVCLFLLFIILPIVLLRFSIALPDALLIGGVMVSLMILLGLYTVSVIDAYRIAAVKGDGYMKKNYNRWYVYLLLWCIGFLCINGAFAYYTQNNILMFCHIETGSMEPAVVHDDFVIFDNTTGNRMSPQKDAVVLFYYPDDRSKRYVKRLAGLPGDTVVIDSANTIVVPHGHIYVLGDNRQHAEDSRTFGPVPLADVIGVARQVYFSLGPKGVRWNRIGKRL